VNVYKFVGADTLPGCKVTHNYCIIVDLAVIGIPNIHILLLSILVIIKV